MTDEGESESEIDTVRKKKAKDRDFDSYAITLSAYYAATYVQLVLGNASAKDMLAAVLMPDEAKRELVRHACDLGEILVAEFDKRGLRYAVS
jgi:hypothetical protein